MNRRAFTGMMVAGAASPLLHGVAIAQPAVKARNIMFVPGLFADGSCWSEVIARLQPKGIQVTAVQNLLTTQEAIETTQHALALRQGPAVLVAHSLASTIVTEAGADPTVSALIYVATRAPDPGADYPALANGFPTTPAVAISSRVAGAKHTLGRSPMSAKCAQRNSWSPRSIAGAARQGGEVTISSAARTVRTVRLSRLRTYSNLRRSVVREHPAEPRMRSSTICGRSRLTACRILSGMQLPIAREASATKSPTMLVSAGVSANPMISSPSSQTTSENVTCRRVRYLARHSGVMEM
jgi:hypothetical protein